MTILSGVPGSAIDPRELRVSDAERAHVMSLLEKATGRGEGVGKYISLCRYLNRLTKYPSDIRFTTLSEMRWILYPNSRFLVQS